MSCQVALKIWTAITTDSLGCQLSCQLSEHIELTGLLECIDLNRTYVLSEQNSIRVQV